VPTEADTLAGREERHIGGDGVDDSGNFMAGNAGVGDSGKDVVFGDCIAVADAAGLDANAHMARAGLGELFLHQFKGSAGGGNLHCTASYGRHKGTLLLPLGCRDGGRRCMKKLRIALVPRAAKSYTRRRGCFGAEGNAFYCKESRTDSDRAS